jgi:ribonucleoside-diphosphate reductase alpha chain
MLMVSGIPYDSEEARAIGGAITAIMTGVSYKTSAEMAEILGPFPRYSENAHHMLRVMRNHRAAAYDAVDATEGLSIKPIGINSKYCPDYLLKAACKSWDDAVQLGEMHGYRNAQTTVIAPTGTIGLVMDCDTTGVEPDFALVKFKKLSGGGYFKIINQSVPQALKKLGYNEKEVETIVNYAKGSASLHGAPHINHQSLSAKGFLAEELQKLEAGMSSAFHIKFAFNHFSLGEACMLRMGFAPEDYNDFSWSMLEALGFSEEQIEQANEHICGTMTIEGAPYLKHEHYAVFDCANKNGEKGQRFIHAYGHIKMMAACQPFLSGAISKTINLPNEATIEEISECYRMSWELGLKANALYRDGSKLSQPLSNKSDEKKKDKVKDGDVAEVAATTESNIVDLGQLTIEELLEEVTKRMQESPDTQLKRKLAQIVERRTLPAKRHGFTQKAKINGSAIFLRTGEYTDGTLGEIFIDLAKEGSTLRSLMNCFAIAVSVGLQYGVPLEEFVEKFVFTKFEPSGMVDHPNIKTTTSLVDFVFRCLAYDYLGRTDLVHVLDKPDVGNMPEEGEEGYVKATPEMSSVRITPMSTKPSAQQVTARAQVAVSVSVSDGAQAMNEHLRKNQSDAPACNVCGHITVRSGTCYKCLNCGNSLGCS